MRSAAKDLRDLLVSQELYPRNTHNVGFDLSKVEKRKRRGMMDMEDVSVGDGITFIDLQGRAPEPFDDGTEYPIVQVFFNFVGKKMDDSDYLKSSEAAQTVKSVLHRYYNWRPINGAIYHSVLENTSAGYLDLSTALSFPMLSTNFECQRQPFFIKDRRRPDNGDLNVEVYKDLVVGHGNKSDPIGIIYGYEYSASAKRITDGVDNGDLPELSIMDIPDKEDMHKIVISNIPNLTPGTMFIDGKKKYRDSIEVTYKARKTNDNYEYESKFNIHI